ncbi:MAG: hypothetical protein HYV09_05825 [Deltaproteobacteria bacterium]|nr:hypothetical protein [Deltaproteobacteria bacterium]
MKALPLTMALVLAATSARAQTTFVTVDGEQGGLVLERAFVDPGDPGKPRWVPICAAPCNVAVPVGAGYRINGRGRRASDIFVLDGERAKVRADTGSSASFVTGIAATCVGGALLTIAAGLVTDESGPRDVAIIAVSGVAMLVTGLALLSANKTTVRVSRDGATASLGPIRLAPEGIVF